MPSTVAEREAHLRATGYRDWTVPTCPDLAPHDVPWAESDPDVWWRRPITDAPIDLARTAACRTFDVTMRITAGNRPWDGTSWGKPFQIVAANGAMTPVWDETRAWFQNPYGARLPLPSLVRRESDPGGEASDRKWLGVDPVNRKLWEVINLGRRWWLAWASDGWAAGGIALFDTARPYDAPGQPLGTVAGKWPLFPLMIRWDEIRRGRIDHAVHLSLPNYAARERIWPARGTDGTLVGHPLRAGDRFRLRRGVVERYAPGTVERIICEALWEFGMILGDKNTHGSATGSHGFFPLTQDRRWAEGDGLTAGFAQGNGLFDQLRLSDFDVVVVPR